MAEQLGCPTHSIKSPSGWVVGTKSLSFTQRLNQNQHGWINNFWAEGGWLVPQGCRINGNMPTRCCLLHIGTYMSILKIITPEIPAMPQSRTGKQKIPFSPFYSITTTMFFPLIYRYYYFFFFLRLRKGLGRHSIQPLPPNVLLNKPNIL